MEDEDITSATTAKTLWTETILEVLYLALKYDKPDKDVRKILLQVRVKGFKPTYIIRKIRQKLGDNAASRIKVLLQ